MEILFSKNYQGLLDYLPHVKSSLPEWLFIDVSLAADNDKSFGIVQASELLHSSLRDKEGKIYICNEGEILMLMRWGNNNPSDIVQKIETHLPAGRCEIFAHELTPEGLKKFELLISYRAPIYLADVRRTRPERVILVADDDMYIRLLVKKGVKPGFIIHEVSEGHEVVNLYKKLMPNVLFLDIHLPNVDGIKILHDVLLIDPQAYVIMLSADSSRENVDFTAKHGAKGFLTKPFTKEKLQDYVNKCPTVMPLD